MTRRFALANMAMPALAQVLPDAAADPPSPRWLRSWGYQAGGEHGNLGVNRRFRVNAPEVVLHPTFGSRNEVKSSGMLQILVQEDLRKITAAELYLELWGGHPGTMHKRVTPNGRTTYWIPEVGTAAGHCTHQYPTVRLKKTDLVSGHKAFQFACDQGPSFWGHFIVEQACLQCELPPDQTGLAKFSAEVVADRSGDGFEFGLKTVDAGVISRVEYRMFYSGYDENGNGVTRDWHGFTKARVPVALAGVANQPPFKVRWDTSMLPAQRDISARATLFFKDRLELSYETRALTSLSVADRDVVIHGVKEKPVPFWSRANQKRVALIHVDAPPSSVEQAELHVVVWDGGRGNVRDCFTLNGHAIEVAGEGRHCFIQRPAAEAGDASGRSQRDRASLGYRPSRD